MSLLYILDGHEPVPCDDLYEWGDQFHYLENRRVAVDTLVNPIDGSGINISTVFLGIDHGVFGSSPVLFETMVSGKCPYDEEMERYSTWDDAEKGHKNIVASIQQWADTYHPPKDPEPVIHNHRRRVRVKKRS